MTLNPEHIGTHTTSHTLSTQIHNKQAIFTVSLNILKHMFDEKRSVLIIQTHIQKSMCQHHGNIMYYLHQSTQLKLWGRHEMVLEETSSLLAITGRAHFTRCL